MKHRPWIYLLAVPFVALLLVAADFPPPYVHSWLTTNTSSGTFGSGQVPTWNIGTKQWNPGSAGTTNFDGIIVTNKLWLVPNPTVGDALFVPLINGGSMFVQEFIASGLDTVQGTASVQFGKRDGVDGAFGYVGLFVTEAGVGTREIGTWNAGPAQYSFAANAITVPCLVDIHDPFAVQINLPVQFTPAVGTILDANGTTKISLDAGNHIVNVNNAAGTAILTVKTNVSVLSSLYAQTNEASFGPLSGQIVSGLFWTNKTGARVTVQINYTLTDSAVSGDPSLNMTNISSGQWFNATNSFVLSAVCSGQATFLISTNEYFIATNKSSGNASATVDASWAIKQ